MTWCMIYTIGCVCGWLAKPNPKQMTMRQLFGECTKTP
jgi:hypothetical protein